MTEDVCGVKIANSLAAQTGRGRGGKPVTFPALPSSMPDARALRDATPLRGCLGTGGRKTGARVSVPAGLGCRGPGTGRREKWEAIKMLGTC